MSTPPGSEKALRPPRVAVIVLGDVGRSPRMQYHVRSLVGEGALVDLIGELGTPLPSDLLDHPNVRRWLIAPARADHERQGAAFILSTGLRVFQQFLTLLYLTLIILPTPEVILVQNPPAIPTLLVGVLAARLRRCRLVIDWHNLGHTLVAARVGRDHWITRLTEACERWLGPKADAHFCVSRAMQQALRERWGITATLLYDEPAEHFRPVSPHMRDHVLATILDHDLLPPFSWNGVRGLAVVVTATSWTPDEDFDLLLDAAVRVDKALDTYQGEKELPDLLIILTGEGRLRAAFEDRVSMLRLRRVHLHTEWLSTANYARLLGAADLGLSLHRSTSGIDLPMKVADMLGSGLPILALDYGPCLAERIDHRRTGMLFRTAAELAALWIELFRGFPKPSPLLARLRRGVAAKSIRHWTENWKEHAAPVLLPGRR